MSILLWFSSQIFIKRSSISDTINKAVRVFHLISWGRINLEHFFSSSFAQAKWLFVKYFVIYTICSFTFGILISLASKFKRCVWSFFLLDILKLNLKVSYPMSIFYSQILDVTFYGQQIVQPVLWKLIFTYLHYK